MSLCPLVVQSYTVKDKVLSPLTPRKYTVLNCTFGLEMRDVFQERDPGVTGELSV
jgi:hypothetical protein